VTRRTKAFAASIALLATLTACGSEQAASDSAGSGSDLGAVSISGDFGSEPKVEWKKQLVAKELDAETLVEGDGEKVGGSDQVFVRLYVGNGYTKSTAYSTFGKDAKPDLLPAAGQLSAGLKEAIDGHTLGSRVAVTAPPKDAFGEQGNPQLGVGNTDSVLFIVDLISTLSTKPSGETTKPASWAPKLTGSADSPTGFDFAGTPQPSEKLQTTYLIKGDGEKTKTGDTVYVNYVGQVYEGKKPFDSSFERGEPFDFTLGQGGVIKGWDQGFTGVPIGSRIIISVPPKLGYGKAGNKEAGIKGTDTLFFAVDVLGVS
jgi:peptidylprolyl isomerase